MSDISDLRIETKVPMGQVYPGKSGGSPRVIPVHVRVPRPKSRMSLRLCPHNLPSVLGTVAGSDDDDGQFWSPGLRIFHTPVLRQFRSEAEVVGRGPE